MKSPESEIHAFSQSSSNIKWMNICQWCCEDYSDWMDTGFNALSSFHFLPTFPFSVKKRIQDLREAMKDIRQSTSWNFSHGDAAIVRKAGAGVRGAKANMS